MKHYTKPTIEITRIDSGESIMKVSSANINGNNIIKSDTVNTLGKWNS
jgi:hypothetical protein